MLDWSSACRPGSLRIGSYGSGLAATISRTRWKIAFASRSPRASLSCRPTRASRVTCSALSSTTTRATMPVTPAICLARIESRISASRGHRLLAPLAAQLVQLVVQGLEADAEDFRGARLVVAGVLQRHQDQLRLGFLRSEERRVGEELR